MEKRLLLLIGIFCVVANVFSQTIYVDAVKGNRQGSGTVTDPLVGIEQAVALASTFDGIQPVTIKIAPGLYTVSQKMEIKLAKKNMIVPGTSSRQL